MGRGTRILTGALFLIFVLAIALRPLLSNPMLTELLGDGISDPQSLLLLVVVLLPAALLVGARLTTMRRDTDASTYQASAQGMPQSSGWDTRGQDSSERIQQPPEIQPADATEEETADETSSVDTTHFLAGQGGARNRHFMIEEEAPDAELSAHLEHLKTSLDDESRAELKTLEEVVDEYEEANPIPKRCPHDDCEAAWTERTVLGIGRGKYDVLEDESEIVCLECERSYEIDPPLHAADRDDTDESPSSGSGADTDGEPAESRRE